MIRVAVSCYWKTKIWPINLFEEQKLQQQSPKCSIFLPPKINNIRKRIWKYLPLLFTPIQTRIKNNEAICSSLRKAEWQFQLDTYTSGHAGDVMDNRLAWEIREPSSSHSQVHSIHLYANTLGIGINLINSLQLWVK